MKRILLFLLTLTTAASAQVAQPDSVSQGGTSFTPQFSYKGNNASTVGLQMRNPLTNKFYGLYTAYQQTQLFPTFTYFNTITGTSTLARINAKADSTRLYGTVLPTYSPLQGRTIPPRGTMIESYDPTGNKIGIKAGRNGSGKATFSGTSTTVVVPIENALPIDSYIAICEGPTEILSYTPGTGQVTFNRPAAGASNLTISWVRIAKDAVLQGFDWKVNNANFPTLKINTYTVVPDVDPQNGQIAGNSGMSYNEATQEIIIGYYNYQYKSQLHLFKRSQLTPYSPTGTIIPTPNRIIDITDKLDHLQGVAWDKRTGWYYVMGTIKGAVSSAANRVMICVDDSGKRMRTDWFPDVSIQPGTISIYDGKLYLKPNDQTYLRVYDLETMQLLRHYVTSTFGNEGMGTGSITGNIYLSTDGGAYRRYNNDLVQQQTGTLSGRLNSEMEGMFEDPSDQTLWTGQDSYLHGFFPNGNVLYQWDVNTTYAKTFSMPQMAGGWRACSVSNSIQIYGDVVYGHGNIVLPVIDMNTNADYLTNLPTVTQSGKTITINYRGSNTAPTTTPNTDFFVTTYAATQTASGWGTTTPSSFSASVSNFRYQQVRLTIAP